MLLSSHLCNCPCAAGYSLQSEIEIVNGDGSIEALSPATPTSALESPEASLYLVKTQANSSDNYTDGETKEAVLKSRGNVYRELVETEKVYIKDMQTVINVSG